MTSGILVAWQSWETVSAAPQKTQNSEVQPWKTTKNPAKSPSQAASPQKQPLFSLGCLQVLSYCCRLAPMDSVQGEEPRLVARSCSKSLLTGLAC